MGTFELLNWFKSGVYFYSSLAKMGAMAIIFKCILSLCMILHFVDAIHLIEKRQLKTCPGFPGYCSEAYPGGVCTVVCAFGRPNVPECQPDGTWDPYPVCEGDVR